MEFRIQYRRSVCTHYFPVPFIGHSLGNVHVCMHACQCVSSVDSSVSDITKCWIVPKPLECLSQHIQALTPTPGSCFISVLPLSCLGFDTLHWHIPMCRYCSCSTQPLTAHPDLPHLHPWMTSSPCLASEFLHKSASSLWISSSLNLCFYSSCLARLLFNILQINWLLWQTALLCECVLIPLWHWLPMACLSMYILFSLLKYWHLILHTSLPCSCGSYHFTLFEFWPPILGYSDCVDILLHL